MRSAGPDRLGAAVGDRAAEHDQVEPVSYTHLDVYKRQLYADKGSTVRIFISRITTSYPAGSATWAVTGCLYPA